MRQALTFVLACTLAASGLHAQAEYDAVDGISEIVVGNGFAIYIDDPKLSEAKNYRIVVTRRADYGDGPFSSGAIAPSEVFGDSRTGRFVLAPAELTETLYDSGTPDDPSDDGFASNLYRLTGISVDNPGTGYFGTSTVTVEGPGGPTLSWDVEVGRSAVSELTLTNGGSGYRDPPAVAIEGGGGSGAAAVATIGGQVRSIELTSAGTGYTEAPTVAITGGGGAGATATASFGGVVSDIIIGSSGAYSTVDNYPDDDVLPGAPQITIEGGGGSGAKAEVTKMNWYEGIVGSVTITNGGSGYVTAPDVTITSTDEDGSPAYPDRQEYTTATGTASIVDGVVTGVRIDSGGNGYRPYYDVTVSFTGGGGTGAEGTANLEMTSGYVIAVEVTDPGSGYTSAPTVTFTPSSRFNDGYGAATATATIEIGIGITVTNGGSGYVTVPDVTLSGGGGSGAEAAATIMGQVLSIELTNPGLEYESAPTVTFTSDTGSGATATASISQSVGGLPSLVAPSDDATYFAPPSITVSGAGTGAALSPEGDIEAVGSYHLEDGNYYGFQLIADYGSGWTEIRDHDQSVWERFATITPATTSEASASAYRFQINAKTLQTEASKAFPYELSETSREHWYRFNNAGVSPSTLRALVDSTELSADDVIVTLHRAVDEDGTAAEAAAIESFTLGEWQVRLETLTLEVADRRRHWFFKVALADGAEGGLYGFQVQKRPNSSDGLDIAEIRQQILDEDDSVYGAVIPRQGGSVTGFFEVVWDYRNSRWADYDPFYIVTPDTEDLDVLIWVTGDSGGSTWGRVWDGETDEPNSRGLVPGAAGGDEFMIRRVLKRNTAYEVGVWATWVRPNPRPPGEYEFHVRTITEPGTPAAETVAEVDAASISLNPDSDLEFVRGANISPANDADYFKFVFNETREVMIRGVSPATELSVTGSVLKVEGETLVAYDATLGHDTYVPPYEDAVQRGFTSIHEFPAGTYYLKVEGNGTGTGRYTVGVADDAQVSDAWKQTRTNSTPGNNTGGVHRNWTSRPACYDTDDTVSDPMFGCQFTLHNRGDSVQDQNVPAAWDAGATGSGVKVRILDGSFDSKSPDIVDQIEDVNIYTPWRSTTLNLVPGRLGYTHGTTTASVIAAAANDIGIRGIAYEAKLSIHNVIENPNDANIIRALTEGIAADTRTSVMNHSWGVFQGALANLETSLMDEAFTLGLEKGFGGLGVSHVMSAGNDYWEQGYASLDENQNHIGVMQVCAVNDKGRKSWFSEHGSNLWICGHVDREDALSEEEQYWEAYSSPAPETFGRHTNYSGTSSASPHVAGVVALVREANPNLNWREVKLILAATARKNDPDLGNERSMWEDPNAVTPASSASEATAQTANPQPAKPNPKTDLELVDGKDRPRFGVGSRDGGWRRSAGGGAPYGFFVPVNNAEWMRYSDAGPRFGDLPTAGNYSYSHRYGFGTVDAGAAVALAKAWTGNLPELEWEETDEIVGPFRINDQGNTDADATDTYEETVTVSGHIDFVEWVDVYLDIHTDNLRDMRITLESPSGSSSLLASHFDECWSGYGASEDGAEPPEAGCHPVRLTWLEGQLKISSARFLGEDPEGPWTIKLQDVELHGDLSTVEDWSMKVWGHSSDDSEPAADETDGDGDETGGDGETDGDGDGETDDDSVDGTCASNATTLCLQDSRFKVEASWQVNYDDLPRRTLVEARTQASGILAVGPDNEWGLLVKLLDGCDLTGGLWAMLSETHATLSPADWSDSTSNQNKKAHPLWTVRITDTVGGGDPYYVTNVRDDEYTTNALRTVGRARIDRYAFPQVCSEASAGSLPVKVDVGRPGLSSVTAAASVGSASSDACGDGPNRVCLYDRFDVLADWKTWDRTGNRIESTPIVEESDSASAFWFHTPENIEVLVKISNHCAAPEDNRNRGYRVQVSGATLDGFQVRVADTWHDTKSWFRWWEDQGMGTPPDPNKLSVSGLGRMFPCD